MEKRHSEWEEFFDGHAPHYMDNVFVRNTDFELKFIDSELALPRDSAILDIGCGTGRHSVGLAKLGYRVTGVDLSQGMLNRARWLAQKEGAEVELVHADAVEFRRPLAFDGAICLCEGAFCLIGMDDDPHEHDRRILENIAASLKPAAPFLMTTLSAFHAIRSAAETEFTDGSFDLEKMLRYSSPEFEDRDGKKKSIRVRERWYVPTELRMMFEAAGFRVEYFCRGTAGNWERSPIGPDDIEIMIKARKAS
ncbi:MAG: methyltransferase domain-containing protein [Candidatus Brocadiia bacterium]